MLYYGQPLISASYKKPVGNVMPPAGFVVIAPCAPSPPDITSRSTLTRSEGFALSSVLRSPQDIISIDHAREKQVVTTIAPWPRTRFPAAPTPKELR